MVDTIKLHIKGVQNKELEIIEVLRNTKELHKLKHYRFLERLKVGNYYLSVQASEMHYCIPRIKTEDFTLYSSFEVAIFNKKGNWIQLQRSKVLKSFFRYEELLSYNEEIISKFQVYCYMPKDLVNDLYLYLKNT